MIYNNKLTRLHGLLGRVARLYGWSDKQAKAYLNNSLTVDQKYYELRQYLRWKN